MSVKNIVKLAKALSHECVQGINPSSTDEMSVEDLHREMERRAEEHNSSDRVVALVRPWDRVGDCLCWVTGTGRMRVEASTSKLICEFYSPSFEGGKNPFFKFSEIDGVLSSSLECNPSFLVDGSGQPNGRMGLVEKLFDVYGDLEVCCSAVDEQTQVAIRQLI